MGKYLRLGLGIAAGIVAGVVIYKAFSKKRDSKLAMPGVKAGNIVKFPARIPPFAESAENGID